MKSDDATFRAFVAKQQKISVRAGLIAALLGSGVAALGWLDSLRDFSIAWTRNSAVAVAVFGLPILLGLETLNFLLAFVPAYRLERLYGVSTVGFRRALKSHILKAGIRSGFLFAGLEILYWTFWDHPHIWWLLMAATYVLYLSLLSKWMPIIPIFFRLKPLQEPGLLDRISKLTERCGARLNGIWVWRVGHLTRRGNAMVIGWGSTRRIIISDTLLETLTPEEIEAVLAHEIAHHVKEDVLRYFAIACLEGLMIFFLADRLFVWTSDNPSGLRLTDLGNLPLVLMWFFCAWFVVSPFANAVRRWREKKADEFAIRLTGNRSAFISMLKKLAAQNLYDPQLPRLFEIFFSRHPSTARRISYATRMGS